MNLGHPGEGVISHLSVVSASPLLGHDRLVHEGFKKTRKKEWLVFFAM